MNYENKNEKDECISNYSSEIKQQQSGEQQQSEERTPWKQAMDRIIAGIIMGSITLGFFKLNYILPTIAMFLTLLGFRMVSKKNKWFLYCYALNIIRLFFQFINLIVHATIFTSMDKVGDILYLLDMSSLLTYLILLYCLYRGIKVIQEEVGVEKKAGVVIAFMLLCYIILWILLIIKAIDILILGIYIITYIIIIFNLIRLPKKLDDTRVILEVEVPRVSDRAIVIPLTSILLICILCGNLFFSSFPMEWREVVEVTESVELKEVKQHLMELGFPEDILNDLSEEDILACSGATRLVMESNEYYANSPHNIPLDKKENIKITGIGVQLDSEREEWKIIHHFRWLEPTRFYGTEAIQLWQAYNGNEYWNKKDDATGQVLYNKNGKVYTSLFYSLGEETYKSGVFFQKPSERTDLFATFSYPRKGTEQRGYISYSIVEMMDSSIINSWVNYVHQKNFLQYPAVTAKEHRKNDGFSDSVFTTIQEQLLFYSNDEVIEPLSKRK